MQHVQTMTDLPLTEAILMQSKLLPVRSFCMSMLFQLCQINEGLRR